MNPLARLARRGQRPAAPPPGRLGGADGGPGALSTLELDPSTLPSSSGSPSSSTGVRAAPFGDPDDVYAADRFTVELDEPDDPGPSSEQHGPHRADRTTSWRLLGRLALVVGLCLLAFHESVADLFRSIASGSVVVYVLALPLYAGLAAAASNRRPGYRIASGVRVRDVVVGALACVAALGVTALLGPGLSGVHGLWRLDLLMLWLFLLGANVLAFGLRQAVASWPFWVVLLLLWPFPVRLANAAAGGALGGTLLLLLVVLAVVAYGHRTADPPRWQVLCAMVVAAVAVAALLAPATHPQRMPWPSVAAGLVAAVWWGAQSHVRVQRAVVEHRVRGTVPVLVVLAVVGLVVLPAAPRSVPPSIPSGITSLSLDSIVVPGFSTTLTRTSKEQERYYGRGSTWQRVGMRQGDSRLGPARDGRDIVVDVISTPRPQVLNLYPVVTTYPMGTLSSAPDAVVDLGHDVVGQLYRAEDADRGITYTLLTFSWRLPVDMTIVGGYSGPSAPLTQRFTLIAVDDHRDGAAFPEPGNATLDGIRAAIESVGTTRPPRSGSDLLADEKLLDDAARSLVHQRLTGG